jgi:uncharacterized membrane protein
VKPLSLVELWLLRIAAVLGLGLSGYLMSVSLGQRAAPPGCGPGSACETVLASKWSYWLGMPVSLPAMLTYLIVALSINQLHRQRPAENQAAAWTILTAMGATLLSAAAWFIGLQVFVLGRICPWCVAAHALGATLGTWLLLRTWRDQRLSRRSAMTMTALGAGAVVILAVSQAVSSTPAPPPRTLPAAPVAGQSDTGVGEQRTLVLLGGALVLPVAPTPQQGKPDARVALAVMLDYACPHCRRLHHELTKTATQHEGDMLVLSLPTPLAAACNEHILETEPRFAGSCELARLALAVWLASPQAFAEFEHWLFEPENPRDPREARAYAAGLVGDEALARALADPRVEEQIRRNVGAYGQARIERLPALLSPRTEPIIGGIEPQELQQWLDRLWIQP